MMMNNSITQHIVFLEGHLHKINHALFVAPVLRPMGQVLPICKSGLYLICLNIPIYDTLINSIGPSRIYFLPKDPRSRCYNSKMNSGENSLLFFTPHKFNCEHHLLSFLPNKRMILSLGGILCHFYQRDLHPISKT